MDPVAATRRPDAMGAIMSRGVERIVGSLFILATVSSSLGFILVDSALSDADVLNGVAANETMVLLGAFLLLVDAVAVVVIPALLYPTFRKHNGHLARLYPGSRIVESVVLVIGVVGLLSLVSLSRDYVPGSADGGYQTSAAALEAVYDWGVLLGVMFFFALAGLLLNYVLYRSRLVPRWLAVWGLLAVALLPIQGGLEAFDVQNLDLMSLPFAVQEMVFAVWLIVKGLNTAAGPGDSTQKKI